MPSTIVDDRIRGLRTYIVQVHYQEGQKEMKTFVLYVLIASGKKVIQIFTKKVPDSFGGALLKSSLYFNRGRWTSIWLLNRGDLQCDLETDTSKKSSKFMFDS